DPDEGGSRGRGEGSRVSLIVVNARVHTVDSARPSAQAVAVKDGLIVRVGSDAEIRKMATPATRVIDAGGRLVLPGFNDAHVHLVRGAEELVGVDLRPATDVREMAARLHAFAARIPAGRWIRGGYWDHEAWPEQALPRHDDIDAATPDHPVFVERLDGHMA